MAALTALQLIFFILLIIALVLLIVFLLLGIGLILYIRKHVKRVSNTAESAILHLKGNFWNSVLNLPVFGFIIKKMIRLFF